MTIRKENMLDILFNAYFHMLHMDEVESARMKAVQQYIKEIGAGERTIELTD